MAPEVLKSIEHDPQRSDIFSAAVVLFIMVTKHCPFIRAEVNDKYYGNIAKNDYEAFWKVHSCSNGVKKEFSNDFKDLLSRMLALDPDQRPTIKEIKEHKWFKGSV